MISIADKELGIKATLDIDDVLSGLDSLIDRLSGIPDGISTQIDVSGVDELADSASDAEVNLEQIQEAAGHVGTDLSSIDTSSLEDVSSASSSAASDISSVADSASGVDLSFEAISTAASHAGNGISNIAEGMRTTKDETQQASTASLGLAESFGMVEGIVGALVGIGLATWINDIANAAGNFQDSWLQITAMMGKSPEQMGEVQKYWSKSIDQMKKDTARSGGTIRGFIHEMQIAGLKTTDAVSAGFNAVAGAAGATGAPIETIIGKYKTLLMMPRFMSRSLIQMGISERDVSKATGKSIDEIKDKWGTYSIEQKSAILNQTLNLKYGQNGIDAFKESWEHVKESVSAAWTYLSIVIGKLILPLIVPVLDFLVSILEQVAGAIDGLNPVFKSISGVIILFGGGIASLAGLFAGVSALLGGSVLAPLGSFIALLTGTGTATGLLATLLGPLGWAILAIVAAVAAVIYVWTTWNEEITKLKDNLFSGNWGAAAAQIGGSFQYVGQAIWNALVNAGQIIWNFFAGLPAMIGNFMSWYVDMGTKVIQWIVTGLTSLTGFLETVLGGLLNSMAESGGSSGESSGKGIGEKTGNGIIDGFINWVNTKGPTILTNIQTVFMTILPLLLRLGFLIMQVLGGYLYLWGRSAAIRMVNGIVGFVRTLPGRLLGILIQAAVMVLRFAAMAYSNARAAGLRIVSAIISTIASIPGRMYSWGSNMIARFVAGIRSQFPNVFAALKWISDHLPKSPPKMGPLSKVTAAGMYSWISSIIRAAEMGFNSFNLDDISLPGDAAMIVAGATTNTSSSQTLQVVIKKGAVQIQGNATPETIATAGESLGKGIIRGAISDGINTRMNLQ